MGPSRKNNSKQVQPGNNEAYNNPTPTYNEEVGARKVDPRDRRVLNLEMDEYINPGSSSRRKQRTQPKKGKFDGYGSNTTLKDSDFEPAERDEIRMNIQNLLNRNFKVKPHPGQAESLNFQRKRDVTDKEQYINLTRDDPSRKSRGGVDPFNIKANFRNNPDEEARFQNELKVNRMKRRVVRRRSNYSFDQTGNIRHLLKRANKLKLDKHQKARKEIEKMLSSSRAQSFDRSSQRNGRRRRSRLGKVPEGASLSRSRASDDGKQPPVFSKNQDFEKSFYRKAPSDLGKKSRDGSLRGSRKNPDAKAAASKVPPSSKPDVPVHKEAFTVYIDFPVNGPDGLGWRTYKFQVEKVNGQVIDLKQLIERDFGYLVKDQQLYFNFTLVQNDDLVIRNLDKTCDVRTNGKPTFIFVPKNLPYFNVSRVTREMYTPTPLLDIYPSGGAFCKSTAEFLDLNLYKKLIFPPNRDWTSEFYENRRKLKQIFNRIKGKVKEFGGNESFFKSLDPPLHQLLSLSKGLYKTRSEFEKTARKCVELINLWKVKPQEVKYLYGTGGNKFVMGGLLIRECTEVYAFEQKYVQDDQISKLLKHKIKMLNHIRRQQDDLMVPLACLVDYFGRFYMVYALSGIDCNSLVHGSLTQGIAIKNDLNDIPAVKVLSRQLNIKPHYVVERGTSKVRPILLSSGVEIHRFEGKIYLTDVERLTPLTIRAEEDETKLLSKGEVKFIPLQMSLNSKEQEIDRNFRKVKSKLTMRCSECREYIPHAEYYRYNNIIVAPNAKKDFRQYSCCLNCYRTKAPFHQLQVPITKLKLHKFRPYSLGEFYVNRLNGELLEDPPYKTIPLNPDALHTCGNKLPRVLDFAETPGLGLRDLTSEIHRDMEVIKSLDSRTRQTRLEELILKIQNLEEEVLSGKDLCKVLKTEGVPLRLMGSLTEISQHNYIKELLVREMVSRAVKAILRSSFAYLRNLGNKMNEFNLKKSIAFHMNSIFGIEGEDSQNEWRTILDHVDAKFDCKLEPIVKSKLQLEALALRILDLSGIRLNVDLENVNFSDAQPFLPHFFEVDHPLLVRGVFSELGIDFLNSLGNFYFVRGVIDPWFIETGHDMSISLFLFTQMNEFAKLVRRCYFD